MKKFIAIMFAAALFGSGLVLSPVFGSDPTCVVAAVDYTSEPTGEVDAEALTADLADETGGDFFGDPTALVENDEFGRPQVAIQCSDGPSDVAEAHTGATWFPYGNWKSWEIPRDWSFTSEVSGSAKRDAITRGMRNWNSLTDTFDYSWNATGSDHANFVASDVGNHCDGAVTVHWENTASSYIKGITYVGFGGGALKCAAIQFDSSPGNGGWSTATGSPGSNEWDLEQYATHEAGHAAGFDANHWPAAMCTDGAGSRETMCADMPIGTNGWRSPETHDVHTINDFY